MESVTPRGARLDRRALLGSFVFACIVWAAIRLSGDYSAVETIDLAYELPVGATFAQEPPRQIEATVTARGWDLLRESLRPNNRQILIDSVDLRQSPDGILSIRREVAEAFARQRLQVDALSDPRIVVRTERLATKRVPLELRSEIDYMTGFSAAGRPRLGVDSVVVIGPRSLVRKVESWPTDTLRLSNVADSMRASVSVRLDPEGAIQVSPRMTDVVLRVQQYTEAELYVPVEVEGYRGDGGDSVAVFPAQVLLTCAVGLSDFNTLRAEDFRVVVEVDPDEEGALRQLPAVVRRQPEFVTNVTVQPRLLEVFIVRVAAGETPE